MLITIPNLLKLSGKMIIELPTIELATATPVIKTDFPIGIIIKANDKKWNINLLFNFNNILLYYMIHKYLMALIILINLSISIYKCKNQTIIRLLFIFFIFDKD